MRTITSALAAICWLVPSSSMTSTLTAQGVKATIPKAFAGVFSNSNILTPFGRTKYFGQTWYRGDSLPPVLPVSAIGFRTGPNATYAAATIKIEIVLDNSKVTSALSKTFTANLTAPTTFFSMANVSLPAVNNNSDPNQPTNWIPGNAAFLFLGPNLIVQTDVQTSTTATSTGYNVEGYTMSANARLQSGGKSCGKSTLSSTFASNTYTLNLTGAPATSPATFHVGLDNFNPPVSLNPLGMTNCELYLNPLLAVTVLTNANGAATLSTPLPVPVSPYFAFVQASHPETGANPANYVSTNTVNAIVGNFGISNYVYNWTTFTPTAQYGPYATNRGQIMLLR